MIGVLLRENNDVLEKRILSQTMSQTKELLSVALKQTADDIKYDLRSEFRSGMLAMKREIIDEITEFIGESILPQISELQNLAHWHGSDGAIVLQKS